MRGCFYRLRDLSHGLLNKILLLLPSEPSVFWRAPLLFLSLFSVAFSWEELTAVFCQETP